MSGGKDGDARTSGVTPPNGSIIARSAQSLKEQKKRYLPARAGTFGQRRNHRSVIWAWSDCREWISPTVPCFTCQMPSAVAMAAAIVVM